MNQRIRIALAAILLLGFLGYRYFAGRHADEAASTSASTSGAAVDAKPGKPTPPAPRRRLGKLAFSPCTLATGFGTQTVEAQCTRMDVLENRALPAGRKISLAIAWLPAKGGDAEPDPVTMIAGGPGQSALESFPGIAPAFEEVRKKRDIILVDQRGTGGSNKLVCKDPTGGNASVEGGDGVVVATAAAARCAKQLAAKADLRFYNTSDAIQDLDQVRVAIGAAQLNLMGISYGTRVAQQYARRYPSHTRTVTIDGIVPDSMVLGNEMARNLESSLDRQFGRCAQDKDCSAKLGNPRLRLNALMAKLKTDPPLVRYRDAITGDSREERLTPGHIAALARMFAYAPQVAGLLPLELNEAAAGRYEPLMALAKMLESSIGDSITYGMQLSVICTEDADELKADPADANSLLGVDMLATLQAQCMVWPHAPRPAGFRQPLSGPVPVLILSGEFDPVTPPRYGEEVLRTLPNGRHLVVRGQGHNVLPVGCVPKVFASFIETADAKKLDVGCLDKVPYALPFTGFYGWEP